LVRGALPADAAAIASIAATCGLSLDVPGELARPWAQLWLAVDGDRPIAFLLAWDVADEVHLIDVGTHPDARRRGAARRLLAQLFEHARTRGARLVLLEVRRSNRAAVRLYESFGFRAVTVRRGYYDGGSEDALEMHATAGPAGSVVNDDVRSHGATKA